MFSIIYTTTDSDQEAEKISKELLEKRLVACANIFPINSLYWWQGKIERSGEVAVIFKTRTELLDSAIEAIRQLHSYEVPCIVAYEMTTGHQAYLDWIETETGKEG
ncbi:MAG: divalent-cation tolerance protein CutA [bacterium]